MVKRYGEEFKRETVQFYRSAGKSYKELGRELGVSSYSIRKWVLETDRLESNRQACSTWVCQHLPVSGQF